MRADHADRLITALGTLPGGYTVRRRGKGGVTIDRPEGSPYAGQHGWLSLTRNLHLPHEIDKAVYEEGHGRGWPERLAAAIRARAAEVTDG